MVIPLAEAQCHLMVYALVAIGQFGVILLTQMAVLAGWILASTGLVICIVLGAIIAIHALILHFHKRPPSEASGGQD